MGNSVIYHLRHGIVIGTIERNGISAGHIRLHANGGTVLPVGNQTLSVTFTPTDATDYTTATATVSLTVTAGSKVTPTITWPAPAAITFGAALSGTQLNATASVQGEFAYSPALGTVLGAGTQTLSVTFTPTDTTDYTTAISSVSLTVSKATPAITWATPAAITYGTALGATQLNATSGGVAGSFVYTPAVGTVLNIGTQTLSTTFTPTDTTDYTNATATTSLTVNQDATTTTVSLPSSASLGASVKLTATVIPASATGSVTFKNGSTTLGTATLSKGTATLTLAATTANGFALGSDSITALYVGDSNDLGSTSSAATLTLTESTTTAVTASTSSIALGSSSATQT